MKKATFALFISLIIGLAGTASAQVITPLALNLVSVTTRFNLFQGSPSVFLLIKDLDHNVIKPFLFGIHEKNTFASYDIAAQRYQVISAQLETEFGTIKRFCQIPPKTITNKSLHIEISGNYYHPNPTSTLNIARQLRCKAFYD